MSAWQRRCDTEHRYFVRRYYQDGHRCHQYLGRGPVAMLAAQADAQRWADLQAQWQAGRTEKEQLAATSQALDALEDDLPVLMKAVLLAAGYRQVDRHWRTNPHAT
jgi:hypothetical protein